MSRVRFTIFDLVYFTGEWLDEHYHSLRGVDGVGLVFLGTMFALIACLGYLNTSLFYLTGWRENVVMYMSLVLLYLIVYYVYKVRGRHGRVMAHYRGSIYDSPPVHLMVFLGWMFVPVILILLIREVYGKQF